MKKLSERKIINLHKILTNILEYRMIFKYFREFCFVHEELAELLNFDDILGADFIMIEKYSYIGRIIEEY